MGEFYLETEYRFHRQLSGMEARPATYDVDRRRYSEHPRRGASTRRGAVGSRPEYIHATAAIRTANAEERDGAIEPDHLLLSRGTQEATKDARIVEPEQVLPAVRRTNLQEPAEVFVQRIEPGAG